MECDKRHLERGFSVKYVYLFMIALSVIFNACVQSYAYEAWKCGMPARIAILYGMEPTGFFVMTLNELSEVSV